MSPPEASIATEVELKLAVRPADLPAVQRALEDMAGGSPPSPAKLVNTYFDTPDHALRRNGLVLRVRERNGSFVQTVKSDPAVGGDPLARGEWEDRIAGPQPDRSAPNSGRFIASAIADDLQPLFTTEVIRLALDLEPAPATRIEAAIDRGRIRRAADDSGLPISEVELELKGGDTGALYGVALRLLEAAPLRLARESKAERGYGLVDGKPAASEAVHLQPVALDPAMSGGAALQRLGRACLDHLLSNEAAALAGRPEGIHQMRVAIRRFRALLSTFGKLLPKAPRRLVSEELRWLADALGEVRNLDVFAEMLRQPASGAPANPADLRRLARAVSRRRRAAHSAVAAAIGSTRYTDAILQIMRWLDARGRDEGDGAAPLRQPICDLAPRVLDRRRRDARKRGKGFAKQSPRRRHRLRIALKKLRYAAELLGALYENAAVERFVRPVKRLQDGLGTANDLRVGRDIVAALAPPGAGGATVARTGQSLLDARARRLAVHERPLRKELRQLLETAPFWRG